MKSISAAGPVQTFEAMEAEFEKLFTDKLVDKTMYLYLIDELTLEPVRPVIDKLTGKPVKGSIYPIEITTPSKIVPKLLPVMWVGMRAISLYHGVAGIATLWAGVLDWSATFRVALRDVGEGGARLELGA